MTQLSDFSSDDAELILSLPVRVGMHVSYAEDEEGEQDDEREMQALEACIREIAKVRAEDPGVVQEIADATLNSRDRWDEWSQGVFNIEPQCEKAVLAMQSVANGRETKDYVKMVVEVATAVAQAYGEFGESHEEPEGFFGKAMAKIVGGFSEDEDSHPMNVSAAEDTAIASITTALKKNL